MSFQVYWKLPHCSFPLRCAIYRLTDSLTAVSMKALYVLFSSSPYDSNCFAIVFSIPFLFILVLHSIRSNTMLNRMVDNGFPCFIPDIFWLAPKYYSQKIWIFFYIIHKNMELVPFVLKYVSLLCYKMDFVIKLAFITSLLSKMIVLQYN